MKTKQFTFAIHTLVLVLLLIIPYMSTKQVFTILDHATKVNYLFLCIIFSAILIISFYFNYCFLIPRYLLNKKHWLYFSFLFFAITTLLSVAILLFFFFFENLRYGTSASTNSIIEKLTTLIIINSVLLWLLVIFSSILWAGYNRFKQAESDKLFAQIASLRSQINPHFLFNTLNNIYAVAIEKSPQAADMVDKLSEMMRYTMKDIHQDFVWLEDEINYINNFIELQRVRLDSNVKLKYNALENIPHLRIAPMLLIPFIENAFKHGINPEQKSDIKIEMDIDKGGFQLTVLNNKVNILKNISLINGLGLVNTKNRLKLLYPSNHILMINDTEKVFFVSLNINLQ